MHVSNITKLRSLLIQFVIEELGFHLQLSAEGDKYILPGWEFSENLPLLFTTANDMTKSFLPKFRRQNSFCSFILSHEKRSKQRTNSVITIQIHATKDGTNDPRAINKVQLVGGNDTNLQVIIT